MALKRHILFMHDMSAVSSFQNIVLNKNRMMEMSKKSLLILIYHNHKLLDLVLTLWGGGKRLMEFLENEHIRLTE
jgi:hypothetical protein